MSGALERSVERQNRATMQAAEYDYRGNAALGQIPQAAMQAQQHHAKMEQVANQQRLDQQAAMQKRMEFQARLQDQQSLLALRGMQTQIQAGRLDLSRQQHEWKQQLDTDRESRMAAMPPGSEAARMMGRVYKDDGGKYYRFEYDRNERKPVRRDMEEGTAGPLYDQQQKDETSSTRLREARAAYLEMQTAARQIGQGGPKTTAELNSLGRLAVAVLERAQQKGFSGKITVVEGMEAQAQEAAAILKYVMEQMRGGLPEQKQPPVIPPGQSRKVGDLSDEEFFRVFSPRK